MYGLPQAGSLVHDLLDERLNAKGFFQSKIIPGFRKHKTQNLQFALIVDDFSIKYLRKEDLINTLQKHYDVTVDMEGKEFVKIGWTGIMNQGKYIYP